MNLISFLFSCCLFVSGSTNFVEYGNGSYYSDAFHGKKTASGEIYNKWDYTCAHRTLPFGTKVKVINLDNKKSVIVRVNDRGPFKKDRIIDLSYAAALDIDMIKKGVVKVKIEVVK
ncbi:MAG: septal ring lytic transglycosylase RlpA family protein [candidate division WOR-3 bacterium]